MTSISPSGKTKRPCKHVIPTVETVQVNESATSPKVITPTSLLLRFVPDWVRAVAFEAELLRSEVTHVRGRFLHANFFVSEIFFARAAEDSVERLALLLAV